MKAPTIDFKNPKVQIATMILLLGALVGYIWYTNYIVPTSAEAQKVSEQLKKDQGVLANIQAMRPQLARLHSDVDHLDNLLDSLKSIFPDNKEVPKLIREITRMSKESGVFTTQFSPDADVVREYYVENNYKMSVVGGYHQLATFFSYLANIDLIVNLSGMKIQTSPAISMSISDYEKHGGIIQSVRATFQLTTFSSKK